MSQVIDTEFSYQKFGDNCFQLTSRFQFHSRIVTGNPATMAFIQYDGEGLFVLYPGFCWDGASDGNPHQTDKELWFSIMHDCKFRLFREGLINPDEWFTVANEEMEEDARNVGISHLVADIIELAVQEFGKKNAYGGEPILIVNSHLPRTITDIKNEKI